MPYYNYGYPGFGYEYPGFGYPGFGFGAAAFTIPLIFTSAFLLGGLFL